MTNREYCGLTFREYMAKKDHWVKAKYESDCANRNIVWAIASPYLAEQPMTIYEFMPLELDPTPEEIEEMLKQQQMATYQQAIAVRKQMREQLEKQT